MNWKEFQETAPEMATLGMERFQRSGVALLATSRIVFIHRYFLTYVNRFTKLDTVGEFILDSESVPRAVASVALAKDLPRKSRSLPLAVLIRQQYQIAAGTSKSAANRNEVCSNCIDVRSLVPAK
jgi:hypothetical protein